MAFQKANRAPVMDNRGARVVPINDGGVETPADIDINAMLESAQVATPSAQLVGLEALEAQPELPPQGQATPASAPASAAPVTPEATLEKTPPPVAPPQADKQAPVADPLIERFRTMTPEQQAEAYANLERLRGKQGEELGLLRKLAEQVVTGQLAPHAPQAQPAPAPTPKVNLADRETLVTRLLTEPDTVITEIINQSLTAHKQVGVQERFQSKLTEVKQRYESEPAFAQFLDTVPKWIKDAATTPEAIDDVLRTYTPQQAAPSHRPSAPAHLGVSSAPSAAASPQTAPGRIYTHAELTNMMLRRPQEYAALQADIWKASEEGRVK